MLSFLEIQKKVKILESVLKTALLYLNENRLFGAIELKKIYKFTVSTRYGKIDNIEFHKNSTGVVTILSNFKKTCTTSKSISIASLKKIIDTAKEISKYVEKDEYVSLPNIELLFTHGKNISLCFPWVFNIDQAINLVKLTDSAALSFNSKITSTEGSTFSSYLVIKVLGNSYDWIGSQISTLNYLSSCVIAKYRAFMERDYSYTIARDFRDLSNPQKVGIDSAKKSIAKLNSKKIFTQKSSIIFNPDVSSQIFGYLADALNGHLVYKKSTFLLHYLNKKLFPSWFEISEDPFIVKGLGSKLFDSEGVKTIYKKIIYQGCLKTWLLDTYSSNQLCLRSTGHAGGIHNWIISSTIPIKTFQEQLFSMNTGILVTELFGQGVNIITGDYSKGMCGFWIENGKIQYPISEITISGNLLDMWSNIVSIANDFKNNNCIRASSMFVRDIQISGK